MTQPGTGFAAAMTTRIAERARRLKHDLFDSYHPELHYMRGPGPKWREKHGLAAVPPAVEAPDLTHMSKAGV